MFDLDKHFDTQRRTYSRRLAVLTSTITDDNELDTLEQIEDLTNERREWLKAWEEVQDLVDTNDDAFALFVESFGMDLDTADDVWTTVQAFNAAYVGYMTMEDYAQQFISEVYEVPAGLEGYIDVEKFARDLDYSGDMIDNDGHIFHSNW